MLIEHGYWSPGVVRPLSLHHNQGLELVLVLNGQAEWVVDGCSEWVTPGTLFFTLPWQEHGDAVERDQGLELYFVIVPLDQEYKRVRKQWAFHPQLHLNFSQKEERALVQSINALEQHAFPAHAVTQSLMQQLYKELQGIDEFSQQQVSSLISSLLIQLPRLSQDKHELSLDDQEQRVAMFLQQLCGDCHLPWTLDEMAARCQLARTQFSIYAQRISGFAPKQYLNHLRVQRAKELLIYSNQPITHIAFDCGFESSQYFARVFKKMVGMDARQFRKQHAN